MSAATRIAASQPAHARHYRVALYLFVCLSMDLSLLLLAFAAALGVRLAFSRWLHPLPPIAVLHWPEPGGFFLLSIGIIISGLVYEGIYSTGFGILDRTEKIVKSLSWSFFLIVIISFTLHQVNLVSRFMLFLSYMFSLLLLVLIRPLLESRWARQCNVHPVLEVPPILGHTPRSLQALRDYGFELRFNSEAGAGAQPRSHSAMLALDTPDCYDRLAEWENSYRELAIVPPAQRLTPLGAHPVNLRGAQLFIISHPLQRAVNRGLKRLLDIGIASCLLLLTLPLGLGIALWIYLESRGPVLYGHNRLGKNGKPFQIWKFRTMIINAEQILTQLLLQNPILADEFKANFKLKQDPRLTRCGKWLRRTSLDELPQLWNVLRGDLSLVGPRPIVEREQSLYGPSYVITSTIQPGITGLWQTSGRSNTSYAARRDFDIYYVRNWSLWLDVSLLIKTLQAVLLPDSY